MPRTSAIGRNTRPPNRARESGGPFDSFHLLRYSHLFSSAVLESLESRVLKEVTPLPVTSAQFRLLRLMCMNGEHMVGEVAGMLGVSPPAASKCIHKLEGLGLVRRSPCKGDRRATLLSISDEGRRLVRRFEKLTGERLEATINSFPAAEVEQFTSLLERFAVSLFDGTELDGNCCLRCAAYLDDDCPIGRINEGCPYKRTRASRPFRGAAEDYG